MARAGKVTVTYNSIRILLHLPIHDYYVYIAFTYTLLMNRLLTPSVSLKHKIYVQLSLKLTGFAVLVYLKIKNESKRETLQAKLQTKLLTVETSYQY